MKFRWLELIDYLINTAKNPDRADLTFEFSIDELREDVLILIKRRLNLRTADRYNKPELHLSESILTGLVEDTRNLLMNMPLAYVLGEADFAGETFTVTPDVLIPRPDSEILLEATWKAILRMVASRSASNPLRVIDLGTGSGCLLIILAQRLLDEAVAGRIDASTIIELFGVDISPAALRVAQLNARDVLGQDVKQDGSIRWSFILNDGLPTAQSCSVIMTNPPYVTSQEMTELDLSVALYEPWVALDGGRDGLEPFTHITASAVQIMEQGGYLLVEHGPGQATAMREIANRYPQLAYLGVTKDLAGRDRVSTWMYNRKT